MVLSWGVSASCICSVQQERRCDYLSRGHESCSKNPEISKLVALVWIFGRVCAVPPQQFMAFAQPHLDSRNCPKDA